MSNIYTHYVSQLNEEYFDEVWNQLRLDARRELERRGLLDFTPSIVGIPGATWDEVMDELLQEVFLYVFVERLENLRKKLKNSDPQNIDGIVILQIRNCLTHLQRLQDPIGYRVYELLLTATTQCQKDGEIHSHDGKTEKQTSKINNNTVLAFQPQNSSQPQNQSHPRNPSEPKSQTTDFEEVTHIWLDKLLPDFMLTRGGSAVGPVVQELRELLLDLKNQGVKTFRFKDLLAPLKKETRRRWYAIWSETTGTEIPPHRSADHHGLHRCVTGKIDEESKKKTREDLARAWTFLRATEHDRNGHRPSNVRFAKEIGIDRSRVSTLLETLKTLVAECLSGQDAASRR